MFKCAGPHIIIECKQTETMCENCGLNHKSTYKGCSAFQTFKNDIEKQNKEIQNNFAQKCEKVGSPLPIQIVSNYREKQ